MILSVILEISSSVSVRSVSYTHLDVYKRQTPYTLPPYNTCVVLGPEEPDKVARDVSERVGCKVAIIDVNDLNGEILGVSDPSMDKALLVKILKDNPLGQAGQQTPMGLIRKA